MLIACSMTCYHAFCQTTAEDWFSFAVVMDFAKAFDKVSHTWLLHKLHMYGIDPET